MDRFRKTLPVWVRVVLLAGLLCLVAGAGLIAYRYYQRPTTLTVAVGSFDGEARQAASLVAGYLATTNSPIRLKIENAGNVLDAAKAFAAGKADLAVVRADVGDLTQARAVAVMAEGVVMIVAPPGSTITTIAKLRDHTVGVAVGEINHSVVEALKKEYDLGHANVTFKDIVPSDARRAMQAKEVAALIVVVPLTDKYLSLVKGLFREGANSAPVLIPIDSAGAITDAKGPYESFDIPKGTLRGSPAVPADDVTTLRVPYLLVANRHLDQQVVGELAKRVMAARRDLASVQPLIAGISTPVLDADAYISVHPGAAAFYNG
ncbi:MAG: TAXI family TRAP transporter solute-binding subunit, partial [Bradyrhizobium sp.]